MGYKLPDDTGSVSGLQWLWVAIPDDPAYRTAALGAYTQLADVWRWGLEGVEPDSFIARQQWLEAIQATLEFLQMDPWTTLLGYIDEVETLLREAQRIPQCCPPNVSPYPPDNLPQDSGYRLDGSGSGIPSTWGDGETVADADDYYELFCGQATRFVAYLAEAGTQLDAAFVVGALGLSLVAGLLAIASGLGFVLPVVLVEIAAVITGLTSTSIEDVFSDAHDAIIAAEDDIRCAFLSQNAATLAAEVQATVSTTAWNLFYAYFDYQSALNVAQTGEWNGEYLEPVRDATCDCGLPDPEASGLYFEETGGTTTPHLYDTYPDSLDGVEMYYYQVYKIRGPHPGAFDFRFDDHVGETYVDVVWNILHTIGDDPEICSQCDADPRLKGYLAAAPTTIDWQVSRADCIADHSGAHTAARARYDCCGCNSSTTKGYMEVYFTPAA